MNISELIADLTILQNTYGDIPVESGDGSLISMGVCETTMHRFKPVKVVQKLVISAGSDALDEVKLVLRDALEKLEDLS